MVTHSRAGAAYAGESELTGTLPGAGVSRRRSLAVWLLLWLIAAFALVSAAGIGRAISGEPALLPLDDAYIHMQYARQLAAGQPYIYNPGLPPTSGATSFLYPYLLALAALPGAVDLQWGLWALALGAAALALGGWLIYRAGLALGARFWPAALAALAYTASGAALWHAMSGMETALATLALLLAAYGVAARSNRWTLIGAAFAAVIRPEWAIVTVLAVGLLAWRWWGEGLRRSWCWLWLAVPLALIGLQPLVNLLLTGSVVASGNAAKSIFGAIPPDTGEMLTRWLDHVVRMWRELIGGSLGGGPLLYVALPTLALALLGAVALLRRKETRPLLLLIGGALLLGTLAIATLDTAFWHFKRYQMPMFALLYVPATAGAVRFNRRWIGAALGGLMLAGALAAVPGFARAYAVNVASINAQPLPMARWLAANTPDDAVIAVHDVGMMRFLGGRTTLDMVGLTTPGAADYWRNGPGSMGEFLDRERPDYVASYGEGHGLGLGYLESTSIYGELLARFSTVLDPDLNVALAAASQGIFRPDYAPADRAQSPRTIPERTDYIVGMLLTDSVDVADIASERAHSYRWQEAERLAGFPSEYFEFPAAGCADDGEDCVAMDGGRLISGAEQFTLAAQPGRDAVLITRLNPASAGVLGVYVNGERVAERVVPYIPGQWLEVPVLIPGGQVGEALEIRIVPETPGMVYQPYTHWVYQGALFAADAPAGEPLATWQDGAIRLYDPTIRWDMADGGRLWLAIGLTWATDGAASGDAVIFVHLLDADGAIAAQADERPGAGGLPPGNWLPGSLSDTIMLDVTGLSPGGYTLVAGLYDPVTLARLPAQGGDDVGRVFIGPVQRPNGPGGE